MTYDELDIPWSKQPEHIKQWCRNNGYVIREFGGGELLVRAWKTKYLEAMNNGN